MTPTENDLLTQRRLRITYKNLDGTSTALYEGTLTGLTLNVLEYIDCPIPAFLNGKIGTFVLENLIGGEITLDDFVFSTATPVANRTLPLLNLSVLKAELVLFNIKQIEKNALLNWQTANEQNSDYFDIERSTDAKIFDKIGTVKAFGTTNKVQNYHFLDTLLPPQYKVLYYRLRQVDRDNKVDYSPIRSIKIDKQDKYVIKIYPNPNNGQFIATIPISENATEMMIQNSHGQIVWKGKILAGQESQDIQLEQAPNGLYFVSCRDNQGFINTVKFVINR
jgi:hypothetical protein